jgi:hypothetical protein
MVYEKREYNLNRKISNYEINSILWKLRQRLCSMSLKLSKCPSCLYIKHEFLGFFFSAGCLEINQKENKYSCVEHVIIIEQYVLE